jgi:hypothetical protein
MMRLVLAASAALWAGTALANTAQAPIITWSRADQAPPPPPLTLTSGQVIFTRTPSGLPNGLTAQQLAVKLATQELTLQTLQRQQEATTAETKEYARLQAELARAQAEKEAIARSMAASTQHVATQAAATEARLNTQLLAQQQTATQSLSAQLRDFTTAQNAATQAQTLQQVGGQLAQLEGQLGRQIAEISATRLQPTDVVAIANQQAAQQVAAAKPAFEASAQALALQNLVAAKPYLQTIARGAVADADPAMQHALGQAVGKALAEQDSPAAFSIRKAVVDELSAATQGAISPPTTRLGNDLEPAAGPQEQLDAARLRLGRLLAPGAATPEPGRQVASLPSVQPPEVAGVSLQRARVRTDLMNLRDYKVVVHEDGQTLPDILSKVMKRAEPFTGPWQLKWKVSQENQDLLTEKFSLDAETTFDEFVSYLAQYLLNDRGVKLSFSLFDRERVVLVSD